MLAIAGGSSEPAGIFAQLGLAWLMRDMIGQSCPPLVCNRPAGHGHCVEHSLAGFALPDLAQMGKTPPLRVCGRISTPAAAYGVSWLAGRGAVLALLAVDHA